MANRDYRALLLSMVTLAWGLPSAALAQVETLRPSQAEPVSAFPVASDVRLAGDGKVTRFVMDLDRRIDVRAFALANPDRVVLDIPQVTFQFPSGVAKEAKGLVKAFRYGLVMPGGSRMVFDLAGPARIDKAFVLDAASGQPARLVLELAATDRASFTASLAANTPAPAGPADAAKAQATPGADDARPVVVIDPGHGGIDNGTQAASGESEKSIVLDFALALRERLEKLGKFRVVMTRADDTFIPLGDRVQIARNANAALFVSIHADALPRGEGDAQGATIYTLSDKASDAEAERLAESENKADAIAGVNLTEEPTEVADILIDLAQRETKAFSHRFAHLVMSEMKGVARLHKNPLKSAGFRVLKAPDVPSVLVELGYVSNKGDLNRLVSDDWRAKTSASIAKAIDTFLSKRLVSAGPAN